MKCNDYNGDYEEYDPSTPIYVDYVPDCIQIVYSPIGELDVLYFYEQIAISLKINNNTNLTNLLKISKEDINRAREFANNFSVIELEEPLLFAMIYIHKDTE